VPAVDQDRVAVIVLEQVEEGSDGFGTRHLGRGNADVLDADGGERFALGAHVRLRLAQVDHRPNPAVLDLVHQVFVRQRPGLVHPSLRDDLHRGRGADEDVGEQERRQSDREDGDPGPGLRRAESEGRGGLRRREGLGAK